jgi:hypothetical protein
MLLRKLRLSNPFTNWAEALASTDDPHIAEMELFTAAERPLQWRKVRAPTSNFGATQGA